jgi:chromate transport protein ChrA
MIFIGFSLLLSILNFIDIDPLTSALVMGVYSILSIANVVIILQYVYLLKEEQCTCSASLAREIMQVIAVLYAFFYVLIVIVIIYNGMKIHNLSSISEMSKNLSTNNPGEMVSTLKKTFKSVKKTIKK